MSAIYGVVDLEQTKISHMEDKFHEWYADCDIDRQEALTRENVCMGCELQYFTEYAKTEQLPMFEEGTGVYLTADCVFDNRAELIQELRADQNLPDGRLLYLAYDRWKEDCVKHLRGMFAFVIYDSKTNRVMIAVDQFVSRCIYYRKIGSRIFFSTLMKPLLYLEPHLPIRNQRWVLDSLTMLAPSIISEPYETAYEGIYKIKAATYRVFEKDKEQEVTYWNPGSIRVQSHMTDSECKEKVYQVLTKIAQNAIAVDGNAGILLSGGLDSSSAAGFIAPMLKVQNKKLYSYTAIPEEDFEFKENGYSIANESKQVEAICRMYDNIEPRFMECEGENPVKCANEITSMYELPSKSQINTIWMTRAAQLARKDGCRVLLDAQCGNTTISYGNPDKLINELITHGHVIKACRQITAFCRVHKASRKGFLKYYISNKAKGMVQRHITKKWPMYEHTFVNETTAEHYHTKRRLMKLNHNCEFTIFDHNLRKAIMEPCQYAQMGEYKTKSSLFTGVLVRDVYKDVNLAEFCFTVPIQFFVSDGWERRMIRKYMEGVIPDSIRLDFHHRGLQGADNLNRIRKDFINVKHAWKEAIEDASLQPYLDLDKIKKAEHVITLDNIEKYKSDVYRLVNVYMLHVFYQMMENNNEADNKLYI